jgi:hypothetical protein
MSATIQGDGASVVISQSAPTLCIHVPMFEATDASQIARNNGLERGFQPEAEELTLDLLIAGADCSGVLNATALRLNMGYSD